ncbi:kinesin motor domain-containing protein [Ditylenchus destructor]|uniref:Kinesin-like protein n=1 Tax=Ditylenchus destructor TaxID=166010 RepID=A0AAD4NLM8_9BILA|nr:kinesin motor domain-containing protein [Ditylenchus destructor]
MSNPSECCIQVFCRFRPLNESEKKNGSVMIPKFPAKDTVVVGGKPYVYDHVFDPSTDQEKVYMGAAHHIVQDVLSGYNGTIFAYGQTSSGKTHTMEGVMGNPEKQGIIPRIINDIFNHIYNMDDENLEFHIKVSYFEIYNEKIRDLLDITRTNLPIHEDKNRVPYVKGVTEQFVSNPEEVLASIEEGKNNRQVAVTNMNEHSSRSHSVFQIQVEQENKATQKKLSGKLYLVDLAGSEKVSKTGAEGTVLEEAKNINKSLSALGNVISALAEGTKSHVPYRDSKLTRILQESLGGNSRTTIVICASPASYNEGETKSTLLFGQRAKTIKNVVVVNEELTAEEWKRRYEREKDKVNKLRNCLQTLESELKRWRSGDRVPETEWNNVTDLANAHMADSAMTPSMSDSMFTSMDRANQQPLLSSRTGPITDDERRKYEEERSKLYQQLDEKDDEIQVQSQLAERAKKQLQEQEEALKQRKSDYDNILQELQKAQDANAKNHEETEELFSAIQEIALNLEQKKAECTQVTTENEQLSDDIAKKNLEAVELTAKVNEMREICSTQKKRVYENVQSMLRDLSELGSNYPLPEKFTSELIDTDKPVDEELLAHARICISKLSSDFKSNQQKLQQIESGSGDVSKKLDVTQKELDDCRLQLQQVENKNKSLQEAIESQETTKRQLEDDLDALNAKLAGASKNSSAANEEAQQQQHKLIAQLRDQIAQKNGKINELNESLQELQLAKDRLAQDYERLKNDEVEKEKRYKDLSALSDKREQAKQDLKGLEETVQKELQSLHNLRKIFVQDLAHRMKKAPTGPENEDEFLSSPVQRQKIIFLENNLEQLTVVHKQLVRDNADLRCELPKLEKRYRASMERIKNLEQALRETKENAMKDRKKYQFEVERIKEAVRQRNLARRGLQIAKPIRPGQHYSSTPGAVPVIRPGNASQA